MKHLIPVLFSAALLACGPEPSNIPTLEGELSVEGSTTVAPIIQAVMASIADAFPSLNVRLTINGSGKGIEAVKEGRAGLGMSSRPLKQSDLEQAPLLEANTIARDGLSVITHPSNSVSALTLDQVRSLFTGEFTNWSQVGGADLAVDLVTRTPESGTASFFNDHVMGGRPYAAGHREFEQSTDLEAYVAAHPGAVGYAGLSFVHASVRAVALDAYGIVTSPTAQTVRSGRYPLSRDLLVVTNGPPRGLAKRFFELLISEAGQQAVTDSNLIPVR